MKVTVAVLMFALGNPALARVRAVHPAQERFLWIGAHPDDEALIAPILGPACLQSGTPCSLLVFTHGERGDCALPTGCGDLGSMRSSEMQAAADFFRAHLTLWTFSDVMNDVAVTCNMEAGGHDALIARIQSAIAAENPTILYTFDPNHGSTCHPAHRAVSELVIEAIGRLKPAPQVMFVETLVGDGYAFSSASEDASVFHGDWDYLIRDVEIHASQFTLEHVDSLRHTPLEQRLVWLANVPVQQYSCGR